MIKDEKVTEVVRQQFERKYSDISYKPDQKCVEAKCEEYNFKAMTTRSFHGKFGTYRQGGFHVDFD